MDKIFISIAAYRDPDLVNTVKSFYDNAYNRDSLFFSLVSHEEEDNILDFSFLPKNQYSYQKIDYRLAQGVCSGRYLANSLLSSDYKYFMQTDSHSRVIKNWDLEVIKCYIKCKNKWGNDFLFTKYPHGFNFDWSLGDYIAVLPENNNTLHKVVPVWDDFESLYLLEWKELEDTEFGDLVYGFAANCVFGSAVAMLKIPYDPFLYFHGEEITLGVRAYINDVPLVSPPINFLYTNYDRENGKRNFHWEDDISWSIRDKYSRIRINNIFKKKNLGIFGLNDLNKYEELQKNSGIDFENKTHIKNIYR
jgi:hypothetical protein